MEPIFVRLSIRRALALLVVLPALLLVPVLLAPTAPVQAANVVVGDGVAVGVGFLARLRLTRFLR